MLLRNAGSNQTLDDEEGEDPGRYETMNGFWAPRSEQQAYNPFMPSAKKDLKENS